MRVAEFERNDNLDPVYVALGVPHGALMVGSRMIAIISNRRQARYPLFREVQEGNIREATMVETLNSILEAGLPRDGWDLRERIRNTPFDPAKITPGLDFIVCQQAKEDPPHGIFFPCFFQRRRQILSLAKAFWVVREGVRREKISLDDAIHLLKQVVDARLPLRSHKASISHPVCTGTEFDAIAARLSR